MTDFTIVNVVPQSHSNETHQDAEPSIGVNQADPTQIVISAFTPPDPGQTNGPVYYSEDGGSTWNVSFIVPGGEPNDQTFKFASRSNQFYGAELTDGTTDLNVLDTTDPFVPGTMTSLETLSDDDQPFIEVTTVAFGADAGKDRVYVGHNDTGNSSGSSGSDTAAVDVCLDATVSSPTFTRTFIDTRSTGSANQDGPPIRVAVHPDGTVYAVFMGWRSLASGTPLSITTDIVVVRDDNWASGSSPFTALIDSGDSNAGVRVQTGLSIAFDAVGGSSGHQNAGAVGQERVSGTVAIAVDPRDSDIVVIAWAGIVSGVYTVNIQRSTNRGVSWNPVGLGLSNATNPALAIASTGKIGLLYQQLTGSGSSQKWETHFRDSLDANTWTDTTLATVPANVPALNTGEGRTYFGDYIDLVAVGKDFYGTFCANNTPDPANFPAVMPTFLRNVNSTAHTLLGTDNSTTVDASIDPFFVTALELQAHSDFYVRDWTDSPTSGDTGLEPSTHTVFWSTSDVWNQSSSTSPNPPNANDQPQSENALASAPNYAFARIRRNAPAPAGSGSTTVTAHFLVSEFGTGSNFTDWLFSDPSDPDVTFPTTTDPTVSFAESDTGPLVSPAFEWDLGTTTSDHLCLAVELIAAGDPPLAPGLAGRAPGAGGTDPSIVADNNKAQRNLGVSLAARNARGALYYGIVHNAELGTRDIVLGVAPLGGKAPPKGAVIEVIGEEGVIARRPAVTWDRITLSAMAPGENRWIGTLLPLSEDQAAISLCELRGDLALNGFTLAAQSAPIDQVIGELIGDQHRILVRLDQGFHVPAAAAALGDATRHRERHGDGDEVDFEERVRAELGEMRIEVDVRIRGPHRAEIRHVHRVPSAPREITTANYESYVRDQATLLANCLSELSSEDPFEIAKALDVLSGVAAGDLGGLATAHASVLNAFDAFMTMLQKREGDRADILQMVRWHAQLCQHTALASLPVTAGIASRLAAFIASVTDRTMQLSDYGATLAAIAPGLASTAAALGAGATLGPLVAALTGASSARTQQKAHRAVLLELERHV